MFLVYVYAVEEKVVVFIVVDTVIIIKDYGDAFEGFRRK